jgi:hypothetical protein
MTRYQFQIDDETWNEWKETVPRSKSLEQRIIELIEADRDGRVRERDHESVKAGDEPPHDKVPKIAVPDSVPDRIPDADARAAIAAAVELVASNGGVQRSEIIEAIAPEHPLGYEDIGARGAWWRKVIRPGLEMQCQYENGVGWVK